MHEVEPVKDFAKNDSCGGQGNGQCLIHSPSSSLKVASWLSWLVNGSSFGYRNLFSSLFDISEPSAVSYRQLWKSHWLSAPVLENWLYQEHFGGGLVTSRQSPKPFSTFWAFPSIALRSPSSLTYQPGSLGLLPRHVWCLGKFVVD